MLPFILSTGKLIAAESEYTNYLNFQKALNIGLKSICKNIRDAELKENANTEGPI